jgi:hypothetical protein
VSKAVGRKTTAMSTLKRTLKQATASYQSFLGSALVATLLGIATAALPEDNWVYRFAPLVIIALVFLFFVAWTAWSSEIRRDAAIARASRAVEFRRTTIMHIDSDGNSRTTRRVVIVNSGEQPFAGALDERLAFAHTPDLVEWSPAIEMLKKPRDKKFEIIYQYSYETDGAFPGYHEKLLTVCLGYQIRPHLDPGGIVEFTYSIPSPPHGQARAFTEDGEILGVCVSRSNNLNSYSLHAPASYRFEILDVKAYAPDGAESRSETKWLNSRSRPMLDEEDSTLLRWSMRSPIPGYKYICRYRLKRVRDEIANEAPNSSLKRTDTTLSHGPAA